MPYGVARPKSLSMKSCTRTFSGSPLGRSSRPPFLKSPTNSFFLVSTEMTGSLRLKDHFTLALRCSNWALRSGWLAPSLVLRLACKLYPSSWSKSATTWWLTRWRRRLSSAVSLRTLLQVHRRGALGVSARGGLQQLLQSRLERRVQIHGLLSAATCPPNAPRDEGR